MNTMGFLEFLKRKLGKRNGLLLFSSKPFRFDEKSTQMLRKSAKCIEMPTFDITVR